MQAPEEEVMRNYTTKPINGGITFKCVACGHSVNTLEFDYGKGNRRTPGCWSN
jgi:hypothetical protein